MKEHLAEQEEDLQNSMNQSVVGTVLGYSSKKWVMFSLHSKKQGHYQHVLWERGSMPEKGEQMWQKKVSERIAG